MLKGFHAMRDFDWWQHLASLSAGTRNQRLKERDRRDRFKVSTGSNVTPHYVGAETIDPLLEGPVPTVPDGWEPSGPHYRDADSERIVRLSENDSQRLFERKRAISADRTHQARNDLYSEDIERFLSEMAEDANDAYLASLVRNGPESGAKGWAGAPTEGIDTKLNWSDRIGTGHEVSAEVTSILPLADGAGVLVRKFNPRTGKTRKPNRKTRIDRLQRQVKIHKAHKSAAERDADLMASFGTIHDEATA